MNIVQQARDLFSTLFVSEAASNLGETETGIKKGVEALIPTIFTALINKGNSHNGNILDLINSASGLLDNYGGFDLSNIFSSDRSSVLSKAGSLLSIFFGNKINDVTNGLGNYSGTKQSSITSLLTVALPAIIGLISKYFKTNNIQSEDKAIGFLNTQKDFVAAATPAGLNILSLFDGNNTPNTGSTLRTDSTSDIPEPINTQPERKGGSNWLMWLLLLALIGLAAWFLFGKGCKNNETTDATVLEDTTVQTTTTEVPTTNTSAGHFDTVTNNYIYNVGNNIDITLPDGSKMSVGENSTEAKLYNFLNDPNNKVSDDKTQGWITLDRVYFETGKDVLTQESQQQLTNIANILKNFPNAKVKMGGYTDNTGNNDINMSLSDKRAKMAANELVKLGADKANVSSEGYGSQHPVCPANDTEECKAQNRRVDIRVAAK